MLTHKYICIKQKVVIEAVVRGSEIALDCKIATDVSSIPNLGNKLYSFPRSCNKCLATNTQCVEN